MTARLPNKKIEQHLMHFDNHDLDEEFFGVAVSLNDNGIPQHSGVVICYEGEKLFFHFNGKVLLENVTEEVTDIYYKKLELFPETYLPYIRAYFDILLNTVDPLYGFVFTDSYYNDDGTYVSDVDGLPDFCTCVGFCINVIRGLFLKQTKYLETTDWTDDSLQQVADFFIEQVDNYLTAVEKFEPEKLEKVKKSSYKRILSVELLLSGFFAKPKKLPVRKADISPKILDTRKILQQKWLASGE